MFIIIFVVFNWEYISTNTNFEGSAILNGFICQNIVIVEKHTIIYNKQVLFDVKQKTKVLFTNKQLHLESKVSEQSFAGP